MPLNQRRRAPLLALVTAGVVLAGTGCSAHLSSSPTPTRPSSTGTPTAAPPSSTAAPPSSAATPSAGATTPARWKVVALGDSVTSGGPCGCTPFPELYAGALSDARGVVTTVENLGQDGQDSAGLLAELRDSSSKEAMSVRGADIDLVTIGANDFEAKRDEVTAGQCSGGLGTDCVADEVGLVGKNAAGIVAAIRTLRGGRPTAILVTGYWNVFEDGAVSAAAFPKAGVTASQVLTRETNAAIQRAVRSAGATYVDLYAPFHGPVSGGVTTNLLGADGDHPNAKGQQLIAQRLVAAGLPGLVAG